MSDRGAALADHVGLLEAQLAAEKNVAGLYRGLYREIVKRLQGAFIVAGLGEWTEWQAAIDLFLKAAQAQKHLASLAIIRQDRIIALEREAIDRSAELAAEKNAREEAERDTARLNWVLANRHMYVQEFDGKAVVWDQSKGLTKAATGVNGRAAIDAARSLQGQQEQPDGARGADATRASNEDGGR